MEDINSLEYTALAWESFYDAVDDKNFSDEDSKIIFETLNKKLRFISFSDYLKRYIYKRAGLTEDFSEVSPTTYQQIIKASFLENCTPCSFFETTSKLSALSKNWLTQDTVKRSVVFLLGFGLNMSVDDVNMFLTKALLEPGINPKDPFEVICWYCYKKGYGFLKYEKLMAMYNEIQPKSVDSSIMFSDRTVILSGSMTSLEDDYSLLNYLSNIKGDKENSVISFSSKKVFTELFNEGKRIISDIYENSEGYGKSEEREITEADFEHIICSAVPVDRHGNLTPSKASKLNDLFRGRRFSRQHIYDVLHDKAEVNRFDIITLNFFIFSQKLDEYSNSKQRYSKFIETTNHYLEDSFMGSMLVQNPYECFVLMCILSEDPLGTYADVWELSYNK